MPGIKRMARADNEGTDVEVRISKAVVETERAVYTGVGPCTSPGYRPHGLQASESTAIEDAAPRRGSILRQKQVTRRRSMQTHPGHP
jgi:hypothetical protein